MKLTLDTTRKRVRIDDDGGEDHVDWQCAGCAFQNVDDKLYELHVVGDGISLLSIGFQVECENCHTEYHFDIAAHIDYTIEKMELTKMEATK